MLLVINLSGMANLLTAEYLPKILIIFSVTFVFLLAIFNLGILVSTRTSRSITSMVTLLFVWVLIVLVIPKLSPMAAEMLYPIKSQQVLHLEKQKTRSTLEKELDTLRKELYEEMLTEFNADRSYNGPDRDVNRQNAMDKYDEEKIPLEAEYQERIVSELRKLDNDYSNEFAVQSSIAENLSRISPVSCYTYIVSELSGTGILELNNFQKHARLFQEKVQTEIYDKFVLKVYATSSGTSTFSSYPDDFDPAKAPVPHIDNYSQVTLAETLETVWVDILLLVLFNILFFTASFVSFIRYDVR
ncbi:hypothetical protein ES708_20125 [subsurface metagenome]